MKWIEGQIVVGAPHSPIRYLAPPTICCECLLDCPQPIAAVYLSEEIQRANRLKVCQCYVCEETKECYRLW